MMRLRPEHIEAAVSQGRYSDPRAAEYLVRTIVGRQRKTARHWFSKVNPVDSFRVERSPDGFRLCAKDLLLHHGLSGAADSTRYRRRSTSRGATATGRCGLIGIRRQ